MAHDQSYKALLSHARAVQDLLEGLVAPQLESGRMWVQRIDPTLRGWANDLVWWIRFRNTAGRPGCTCW